MDYISFFNERYAKVFKQSIVYRILYFGLNAFSFALIFYVAMITAFHLAVITSASEKNNLPNDLNHNNALAQLRNSLTIGGAGTSNFPIYTTILSASASTIVSFVGFFYVSHRYKTSSIELKKLRYEKLLFSMNLGKYKDPETRNRILFESTIVATDYTSSTILRKWNG